MSYHFVFKCIHWITAFIVMSLIVVGYLMTSLEFSDFKLDLYLSHKSFGLLILIFFILRLIALVLFKKPKPIDTHKKWEKLLSRFVHFVFYSALFLMPISGWVMSSAGDYTVQFFGNHMPDIVSKDELLFERSKIFHAVLSYIVVIGILLHVAGALKHHFVDKDHTLKRMTYPTIGLFNSSLLALFFVIWAFLILSYTAPQFLSKQDAVFEEGQVVSSSLNGITSNIQEWGINHQNSFMKFESAQYGQSYSGEFSEFDGQIFFDPDDLESSKVQIEVLIASLDTGSDDRDDQALSEDWFHANVFPKAIFKADVFEFVSESKYIAKGSLTVRDVTLPFNLPFDLSINGSRAVMETSFDINRLDYGVGIDQSESANSDIVSFSVEVEAMKR